MLLWQKIRFKFIDHQATQWVWQQVKRLLTASESPRTFAILASLGVLGLAWLNIQLPTDISPRVQTAIEEVAPQDTQEPEAPAETYVPPQEIFTLRRGETLITLLRRATIDRANAHAVVNRLGKITNLRRMQAGQTVRLKRRAQNGRKLAEIRVRDSFNEEATVSLQEGAYKAARTPTETYGLTRLVEGEITDSLYLSALRAGMPKKIIIDLIRMMSFDVDFEREIRVGDGFSVYFERAYSPIFGDTENGRILWAELTLKKRTLEAYFYRDAKGEEGYFDSKGQSTRRSLMKTPLDVAVLTSSYGKRKHPVLGYTRLHKGSDFRAPTGTPIMAAGDGVIEMSARNGSYGNYVRIRHNSTYKTAYAHLSRYGKGVKKGRRVKQGQIIGYSGATGRVTGAHLHYEVFVNGTQVNPMRLKLPSGKKLRGAELNALVRGHTALAGDIDHVRNLLPAFLNGEAAETPTTNSTSATAASGR